MLLVYNMKNKSCFFLCLLSGLLFISTNGKAQTQDSLSAPEDQVQHFSKPELKPGDTAYSMQYVSGTFSVDKWKKNREFSYMRYLDSFLRKQKNKIKNFKQKSYQKAFCFETGVRRTIYNYFNLSRWNIKNSLSIAKINGLKKISW